jgi:hypothetical protein
MKAGREHRVPLSRRALKIVKAMHQTCDGDFVFPGQKPGKPLSVMALEMVLRRSKIEGATVHGFRSTFRDWAAERTNFTNEVCEAALAHVIENKAEAAYRRGDLFDKRRKLMDAWAVYCSAPGIGTVVASSDERACGTSLSIGHSKKKLESGWAEDGKYTGKPDPKPLAKLLRSGKPVPEAVAVQLGVWLDPPVMAKTRKAAERNRGGPTDKATQATSSLPEASSSEPNVEVWTDLEWEPAFHALQGVGQQWAEINSVNSEEIFRIRRPPNHQGDGWLPKERSKKRYHAQMASLRLPLQRWRRGKVVQEAI